MIRYVVNFSLVDCHGLWGVGRSIYLNYLSFIIANSSRITAR